METNKDKLFDLYETMLTIRAFEEKVDELISTGQITGTTHLGIGQEGVMAGAIKALRPEDYMSITHRDHGCSIAKGADLNRMMAELFGKEAGFCKGRGGSLHIVDMSTNNLGANGIVGGGVPIGVGAALSIKMQRMDRVVLNTVGDGAMNEGSVHEAMNLAAVWQLPIVFVCENNQYGMSTPLFDAFKIRDLSVRASAYGFPGIRIDGNDVLKVYETVGAEVEKARNGGGPSLVVCETYRWKGHSKSDPRKYRTKEEEEEWRRKCPIASFERYLSDRGLLGDKKAEETKRKVKDKIENAVRYARECPYPGLDTIAQHVYAD